MKSKQSFHLSLYLQKRYISSSSSSPLSKPPRRPPPPSFSRETAAAAANQASHNGEPLLHRLEEAAELLFQKHGLVREAIKILSILDHSSSRPSPSLYTKLFHLCLQNSAADEANLVYSHAKSRGFDPGVFISNRLIAMFVNSGTLVDALHVFDQMDSRDACSWNTLISGYSRKGELSEARRLFDEMPDKEKDNFSWSSMMSGYARYDRPLEALGLFREMQKNTNLKSNKFTVSSALAASTANIPCPRHGKEIHCHIIRTGLDSDAVVWSALSDMYAKCGSIEEARHIFDRTLDRDVVSWTAMIGRYFDGGRSREGLKLFFEMLRSGVRPNEFTFAGVLNVCSEQTKEALGKEIHGHMMRIGWSPLSFATGALIDLYAKCGNVESARNVFKGMSKPDLVSWTSMISGLAQNGHPELALQYFESMLQSGTKPDHITFVGVLCACTHSGLVDKGLEIFDSIEKLYGIIHTSDHYSCVIDLLCRSKLFEKAEEIINSMPMKPDKFLWASVLGSCRIHGNLKLARRAAEALFEIEPENPATYVTLANIYATAGMWDDVARIRRRMDDLGVVKKPGSSWIEINRQVHHFLVGDESHPRTKEIHTQLEKLSSRMKEDGYVPDTNFVLLDVEEEQKEQNLAHHSEKLAVAFGIIATAPHTTIKVFKNLRICGDCHTAIKFISRIAQREIIVRDSSRFHHFKDGNCTCGDYW